MKSTNKLIVTSIVALLSLYSCSSEQLTIQQNTINQNSIVKNKNLTIRGIAQFDNIGLSEGFKIKNQNSITTRATVSLIYASDHSDINLRNTTVATGLTDLQGNFIINTDQTFSPIINTVMILEASKRIGGAGNSRISIRTNLRWNGNTWESISSPGIIINKKTTALSIISSLDTNIMTSSEAINKLVSSNGVWHVMFNSKLTVGRYNAVHKEVEKSISELRDPVESILYLSPYSGAVNSDLRSAYIKSNMYIFRTMIETYTVDWSVYPESFEVLAQEARTKKYWYDYRNPFLFYEPLPSYLPVAMDLTEYEQAKSTLNYKGNTLSNKAELKGLVIYTPNKNQGLITSYSIYGVDIKGNYLKNDDRNESSEIFVLTNY